MRFDGFGLLDGFEDERHGRRSIVVFSPVGNRAQLEAFVRHVKKLGIGNEADFAFLFRKGLSAPKTGLSELRFFEKTPLGTSGCFFAGQALCHSLGYKTIVVADLDAFLDSRRTFGSMVRMAGEEKCAVVPLSRAPGKQLAAGNYFVMNQWGVFPREVFDEAGFAIPYTCRGGEDWEFSQRLKKQGKLEVYSEGSACHPRAGSTVYHKMANGAKFYPYVSGLMLAFLFSSSYLRYLAWWLYYSFIADSFSDPQMAEAVQCRRPSVASAKQGQPPRVLIRKASASVPVPSRAIFIPASLLQLAFFSKAAYGQEEVLLKMPRWHLWLGMACAALLSPLRLVQGIGAVLAWQKERKNYPYPIMPSGVGKAAKAYLKQLKKAAGN